MKTNKSKTKVIPPGRRNRRKAETRDKIVKSALDLLSKQEYSATTIEQITEAADVGKGTYFNYFASKEHLLYEVGKEQMEIVRTSVEKALLESGDTKRAFQDLFLDLTKLFADNPILARNLILANLGNDSARELMAKNIAKRARWLIKLVKKGQERGDIRRRIKPAMVAHWYLQVYFGSLIYWALQPPAKLEGWLQFSFEQFWNSVATKSHDTITDRPKRKG